MFKKIIENSDTYQKLLKQNEELSTDKELLTQDKILLLDKIADLESEIETIKEAGVKQIQDGNSSVMFEVDDELNIKVHTRVNKEIVNALIDNQYIKPDEAEDEMVINLAFILIANEASEQIIEDVNHGET